MPIVPLAEWVPDAADLGNPGSIQVTNAVPGTNSYKPMPALSALTDALGAKCLGAIDARDKDLNVYQFAGDSTKIYQLSSTSWSNVSQAGNYTTDSPEVWEFVRWKNQMLATNFTEVPQYIDFGGTNFADLTTDFRCRRIAVVRDFVIVGNTYDSTDGNVPDRVRWCAFNDRLDCFCNYGIRLSRLERFANLQDFRRSLWCYSYDGFLLSGRLCRGSVMVPDQRNSP